jgi:hypothetical protein
MIALAPGGRYEVIIENEPFDEQRSMGIACVLLRT